MDALSEYRVIARNTATTSSNKIHDDAVARRHGFAGGLVPGVDVYAYMAHVPAAGWGLEWLVRGSLRARFLAPVYEGDEVTVVPGDVSSTAEGTVAPLEVRAGAARVCALGEAGLPAEPDGVPPVGTWAGIDPAAGPTEDAPEASPDTLRPGTPLALAPHGFHAHRAGDYLDDIGERLPLFGAERVAHPGWLLRDANHVLSSNVALGPWIHVGSVVRHHGLVRDGDVVDARARVVREWERKGHRFVELEVGLFTGGDRLVAHVGHTAIYRLRAADDGDRRAATRSPGGDI
ncbi:MAG TPA: hypothetical protein VFZ68_03840 [Acidimicrobiales bacterium]